MNKIVTVPVIALVAIGMAFAWYLFISETSTLGNVQSEIVSLEGNNSTSQCQLESGDTNPISEKPSLIPSEKQKEGIRDCFDVYEYYVDISTNTVDMLAIRLGEEESFEALLQIWVAEEGELNQLPAPGSLWFRVYDPNYERILDAGSINGQYEFTFTARVAGEYLLVFDHRDGHRLIRMHHKSTAPLIDASGRCWK